MKIKISHLLTIYLQFVSCLLFSQNIDSLKLVIKNATQDTILVKTYIELTNICEPDEIPDYAAPALQLCELNLKKTKPGQLLNSFYLKHQAAALNNLGFLAAEKGEIEKSLDYHIKSLKIREEIKDQIGIAESLANLAEIYKDLGDIPKALETHHKSLKVFEKMNDKNGMAAVLNQIGLIYSDQAEYSRALECYLRSLRIAEETNNKKAIAHSLNSIGVIYNDKNDMPKALEYHFRSLKIKEEINDKKGIAFSLNNIGVAYKNMGEMTKALDFYQKCLAIRKEISDKPGIATSLHNIAIIMWYRGRVELALEPAKRSFQFAKELGFPHEIKEASLLLSQIYAKAGNYKDAYEMHKLYKKMADSLNNETNKKESIQKSLQYAYEKKAAQDSIKVTEEKKVSQAKLDASEASLKQEKTWKFALFGGIAMLLIFAGFMYNRYKITKKQKQIIEVKEKETQLQNEVISIQKHLVEEKQQEITSSINYAKRIQSSFLSSEKYISRCLNEYFILYNPRDIVSGDFYWVMENEDNLYVCTADCTGHGIPGAFMSLIGIGILNEINHSKSHIKQTDDFLNELRRIIILALNPEGSSEEGKDGMDMVLCRYNFQKMELEYSAANNSFYIIRNGNVIECKPDKIPVGKYLEEEKPFTRNQIFLEKGDCIYTFTDGYADQFGGPKGKKFMSRQLKELLLTISDLPMKEQKEKLNSAFNSWKNNLDQVDDVTVIGVRV